MSLRLEMLQVARLARRSLGDSAELVLRFLVGQQNPDGGFRDRSGASDLYYSVFGVDSLLALAVPGLASERTSPPQAEMFSLAKRFAAGFGDGHQLDFVHLCCLARALAQAGESLKHGASERAGEAFPPSAFAPPAPSPSHEPLLRRLEAFRTRDGGYGAVPGADTGTVYGCFLALGAYHDLQRQMPAAESLLECLDRLRTPDGAYTNVGVRAWAAGQDGPEGSTNATAAAVAVLRHLGRPAPVSSGDWLMARWCPQGGFLAAPRAPLPDLLSTATSLHALAAMGRPLAPLRDACLDFLDSLWTNEGSFHAHWAGDTLDTEYTFYALLALGHLA